MKKLLSVLICVSLIGALFAATEQWSFEMGAGSVMDIKADGYGGGAVVFAGGSGYQIVWFDKKGNKLFEKNITTATPSITAVTKKYLVYQLMGSSVTQVIVDKKKNEQTVSSPDEYIFSHQFMGTVYNPAFDKKGFFVYKQNTNGVVKIARYSYK